MPIHKRAVCAAAASVFALSALAACSSVNGGSTSTSGDKTASSGAYSAQYKSATEASPAKFEGPSAAVQAKPNAKIAVITCYSILSGCVSPAKGIEEAAKDIGWQVRTFDGGGTADKQIAQMLNALSWGADIIVNVAIDPNSVQDGLRAAKKAGVPVGAGSNGLESPNPEVKPAAGKLGYAFDVGPDYAALGGKTADWITADSGGKAHVAVYSDKTFPSVMALQKGLLSGLDKCSGCSVSAPQYFTGAQVSQVLPQSVVSYVRSHPETNYVFMPYDPAAAAVVPALQQAGYGDKVKVVGVLGSQENLNFIRDGRVQAADAAYDNRYMGYAVVDQSARLLAGQPLAQPEGENLPYVVLDKSNAPASGSDWQASFDYVSAYADLWKH
jgi:ABC-type sugar transport system substrate-binding protein